ncbi:DUF2063 domain-containing protein [Sphingomonas ginkgonis]|uniref:DUF2063 domain-containing protein n=1 Tax=Sphingomonas ginkgonis TaxID=2315330 RepID=A0A429VBJ6_9SPHN|nr:DNA-binding domain-containing protein [Sphingomonas ginkgonis]RST31256.1 DUF2063 domain-containing protein [Sphingomonas ginkgonis]
MSDLHDFQRDFAAAIDGLPQGAMRVYRNTVLSGCVEALRANFPVLNRLLGEELFTALAVDHASLCPPRSPVLAAYGQRFPDWLEEQPILLELPYLSDVARLERLFLESLFAADQPALRPGETGVTPDWQALRLRLHAATRFDWCNRSAMSIWLAHQDELGSELAIDGRAEGALFTRPRLSVLPIRIDRPAHRFLFGIRLGETVGASAIATAKLYPHADVGALFASLVSAGAFAGTGPTET